MKHKVQFISLEEDDKDLRDAASIKIPTEVSFPL